MEVINANGMELRKIYFNKDNFGKLKITLQQLKIQAKKDSTPNVRKQALIDKIE